MTQVANEQCDDGVQRDAGEDDGENRGLGARCAHRGAADHRPGSDIVSGVPGLQSKRSLIR